MPFLQNHRMCRVSSHCNSFAQSAPPTTYNTINDLAWSLTRAGTGTTTISQQAAFALCAQVRRWLVGANSNSNQLLIDPLP